jgi:cystathionine gamma-synthase
MTLPGMRLETTAVHAGTAVDPHSGAVLEPITLSVTFERDPDGGHSRGYHYGSAGNPNRRSLEKAVAELELGEDAVAYATGSAAIAAVLGVVGPGEHVLIPDDVFQGTARLLRLSLARWGVQSSAVDMTDLPAIRAALRPLTRLIWVETLSNPLLKVTDLSAVAAIAHEHGALCAVDNTFVTPVFQRPLSCGADYVTHAATKFLSGHADAMGGVVVASADRLAQLRTLQWVEGAVPGPFECWLIRRGLKTLPLRMRPRCGSRPRRGIPPGAPGRAGRALPRTGQPSPAQAGQADSRRVRRDRLLPGARRTRRGHPASGTSTAVHPRHQPRCARESHPAPGQRPHPWHLNRTPRGPAALVHRA